MSLPQLTEEISDQDLVADLDGVLDRQAQNGRPMVVTHDGKAAAVLVPPALFDSLTEEREIILRVMRGLHDALRGDLVEDEEVWADIDGLLAGYGVARAR